MNDCFKLKQIILAGNYRLKKLIYSKKGLRNHPFFTLCPKVINAKYFPYSVNLLAEVNNEFYSDNTSKLCHSCHGGLTVPLVAGDMLLMQER